MPFRPVLRPGAPLLRRDATHLQVGTSPGIVLDDRPGLMPLLRLLDGVRDVERLQRLCDSRIPELERPVASVLAELRALGAVVDAGPRAVPESAPVHSVGFETVGETAEVVAVVREVLASVGLTEPPSSEPDVLLIVTCGEAARGVFERASLLRRTHLPVVIDEDRIRIGPFVRPGSTPCVACHDLHRTDWDAGWPAILHQLRHVAPPAAPAALAPLTVRAAAIEIAAEVLAHVEGSGPRTVGGCLVIGPAHDEHAMWPIAFHPRCACHLLSAA